MPHVAAPDRSASGTVRFLLADGSRALVQLDGGRTATVVREQVAALVPLDRALTVGMPVTGVLDASGTELRPAIPVPSAALLEACFPDGVITPALVTSTGELSAELALHPQVRVSVSRRDVSSNPKDRLDDLLEVGDVVTARVLWRPEGIALTLLDVDDEEPVTAALPLLPGGPQWLRLPEDEPEPEGQTADAPEPVAIARTDTPEQSRSALRCAQLSLQAERAETARLRRRLEAAQETSPEEVRAVRADLGAALQENRQLAEQLRSSNRELARLRRSQRDSVAAQPCARTRRDRFIDDDAWLRHELYLSWIDRVGPDERERYPLRTDYRFGPDFAASLEGLDGDRFEKALRAAVDVLTGRAEAIGSRAVHPLRTHESGGAPDVVRADGARCMRCAIENDTASARRLHWWRLRDGGIELSRVVLHDDVTP